MSRTGLEVFDETLQQTHVWLNAIQEATGREDTQFAYHALRATLQTLRDRIGPAHAPKLAAQLPLLIRGIFYEGWDPDVDVASLRDRDAFLEAVLARYGYREPVSVDELVPAVFTVLNTHLTAGLVAKVRNAVGDDLRALWPEPAEA